MFFKTLTDIKLAGTAQSVISTGRLTSFSPLPGNSQGLSRVSIIAFRATSDTGVWTFPWFWIPVFQRAGNPLMGNPRQLACSLCSLQKLFGLFLTNNLLQNRPTTNWTRTVLECGVLPSRMIGHYQVINCTNPRWTCGLRDEAFYFAFISWCS